VAELRKWQSLLGRGTRHQALALNCVTCDRSWYTLVQTREAAEAEMRARVAALPAERRLQLAARYQEAACER
jgi:hypothetical protein